MEISDVVVVGAGIGGAVLALALGRRGWKVTLLEREAQPPRMIRPEVLWGATPAALDQFGVGDVIRKQSAVRLDGVEFRCGDRRLLALTREVLRAANAEAYSTDPNLTREAIAGAAADTGNVAFVRGVEVREIVREGGRVAGVIASQGGTPVEYRAQLVVGDDGAHSVVRSALLTTDMKLSVFPLAFVTAAVDWPEELPSDQVRGWFNPRAIREGIPAIGCLPWPGGRGVVLLPMPHARAKTLLAGGAESFWRELGRLTPLAGVLSNGPRFPADFRCVQRPYGHAPHYVADGVAIIGDAAHPVSPAGGQGANAAIWDALALADVAHDALTAGDVSRGRLARYEDLRRPRNRDSLKITQRVAGVFRYARRVPGLRWLVPTVMRCIDAKASLKSYIVSSFATTFVTR